MDIQQDTLRGRAFSALAKLSPPVRILFIIFSVLLLGGLLFFIASETIYYLLARSYVDEIAGAFDLNRPLANAIVWVSFAAVVFFAGYAFSFDKRRRLIGSLAFLALLIGHSLILSTADNLMAKCYVLTRDSIKVMNRPGIDPQTGRQCRVLTAEMAEKVREYQNGKRPSQIVNLPVTFFSPISGEALVWFTMSSPSSIELFDLMGFNPRTGEELQPVTRQIADQWTQQQMQQRRKPPQRVNPETAVFFDPLSGQPKIWYVRSNDGSWEFYDNKGFHPLTGEELQIVTREALARWKSEADDERRRKAEAEERAKAMAAEQERIKQEQERVQREAEKERDRLARERANAELAAQQAAANERARRERDEAQAKLAAQQAAEKVQQEVMQAGTDCDRLAANPTDTRKVAEGVPFETLKLQADEAISACTRAVAQFPSELRYQYQLGRATQFRDRKKAFDIQASLVRNHYPAAYDNLGWMYINDRRDFATAVTHFKTGAQMGDGDSMVSLAEMIDRKQFNPPNAYDMKLALWRQAAGLGHSGAARALELETAKVQQMQAQELSKQQAQQLMIQMIGGIIAGAANR
jgi:flagellar biosynthesis GTPase FlhF